ncbi:hypothetical protein PV325_010914, partial [Microctonus aethiopoides]
KGREERGKRVDVQVMWRRRRDAVASVGVRRGNKRARGGNQEGAVYMRKVEEKIKRERRKKEMEMEEEEEESEREFDIVIKTNKCLVLDENIPREEQTEWFDIREEQKFRKGVITGWDVSLKKTVRSSEYWK